MKSKVGFIAAIVVSACPAALADENARFVRIETSEGRGLYVFDGKPYIWSAFSEELDARAKSIGERAKIFEVRYAPEGILFILRTDPNAGPNSRPTSEFEARYLAADVSTNPPSITFAKAPTRQSYWTIEKVDAAARDPKERIEGQTFHLPPTGVLCTKNENGEPIYLSIDKTPALFNDKGTISCYPITLSSKPDFKFRFELFIRRDGL